MNTEQGEQYEINDDTICIIKATHITNFWKYTF